MLYVETSVLLAALIDDDASAVAVLRSDPHRVTSALTVTEARRVLVRSAAMRERTTAKINAATRLLRAFVAECDVLEIDDVVLARAGEPFLREPVRALDAIHLATLFTLGETPTPLCIATRDKRIAENARAAGFEVR